MIESFSHKGLERFFNTGTKRGIQPKHAGKLADILDLLDAAAIIQDMNFPGSNLHLLEPKKKGIWAVNVSGNWRVTFKLDNGSAFNVNYVDYH